LASGAGGSGLILVKPKKRVGHAVAPKRGGNRLGIAESGLSVGEKKFTGSLGVAVCLVENVLPRGRALIVDVNCARILDSMYFFARSD
jgi:hypothetical protein